MKVINEYATADHTSADPYEAARGLAYRALNAQFHNLADKVETKVGFAKDFRKANFYGNRVQRTGPADNDGDNSLNNAAINNYKVGGLNGQKAALVYN